MKGVDANVFLYAYDHDEPVKRAIAMQLLNGLAIQAGTAVLLWQVAGEVLGNFRRWKSKKRLTQEQVEENFRNVCALFPLALPSPGIFARSFDLFSKFSLSHWDAMLLAAAKDAGVTTLHSEDMTDGCDYDGVVVVNPFRGC